MEQACKLTEYAYAVEQEKKAGEVKHFLRLLLGTYESDRNTTVAFVDGYQAAMKKIIQQAEL